MSIIRAQLDRLLALAIALKAHTPGEGAIDRRASLEAAPAGKRGAEPGAC